MSSLLPLSPSSSVLVSYQRGWESIENPWTANPYSTNPYSNDRRRLLVGERFKKLFRIVCGIIFLEWCAWSHSITPFLLTLRLWSWYLNLYWRIQLSPQTRKMRGKTLHVWCNPVTLMERQQLRRRSHTGPKWPQILKISVFWQPVCQSNVCAFVTSFGCLSGGQGKWETLHSQIVSQDSSLCAAVLPTSITTLVAALTLPSSGWKILIFLNLFSLYKILLLVCF